ncbi:MAG: helix-turn-helix domain-containing protein, partial [Pseudomonadota bacterium]
MEDIPGAFAGQPIRTSASAFAVLSVNVGRPNACEDGTLIPPVSLLGLQPRARLWQSWQDTYFVMAILTLPGLVRLFPHTGSDSVHQLLDLGAIMGDGPADALSRAVCAAWKPAQMAKVLDRWLMERLDATTPVPEGRRLAAAHRVLHDGGSVARAAAAAEINRRQLQRWCHRHVGVGPKPLADLERLQKSLRTVQTSQGDGAAGYSDQAHQIRTWKRRLGVTPGAYRRTGRSP